LHELEPQGSYVWVRPFSAGSGLPNLRDGLSSNCYADSHAHADCISDANAYSHSDYYTNCDSHSHTNSNRNGNGFSYTSNFTYGHIYAPNADGNSDSNSHSDSNTNGYRNSDANSWAAGYAHSKSSSYSAAAPVNRQSKLPKYSSNQRMKPTPKAFASRLSPFRNAFSVFATTPCRGLSLSR
jgi:hypothetical protein